MRSKADSLPAVDKGSWLDNGNAEGVPRGTHEFSGTSMDVEGQPSLHALPQVATMQSSEGSGPNIFPLSMQAQASAGDDGQPYFLDIFCGTAGVTAALKRYGAEAIGIDHVIDKRRMKGPAVKLDLTKKSSQKLVLDEIRSGRVKGVMLAPPCGTSSRARNIPLRTAHGKRKRGPPPLRSMDYPEGLPGLTGVNRTRVRQANKLYEFCRKVMDLCVEVGALCIVENPQSSLFWVTKWMKNVPSTFIWHVVHACMYGSKRLKKTGFLINFEAPNLRRLCDGSHQHLPWTHDVVLDPVSNKKVQVFDTASEAEYPRQLCEALAIAFTMELQAKGLIWNLEPTLQEQAAYLANNKQHRGARSHAVISEFKHTIQVTVPADTALPEVVGQDTMHPLAGLPVGAKLVRFQHIHERGCPDALKTAVYGVFRTPQEFLNEALGLRHPFNLPVSGDGDNIETIAKVLQLGKLGTMKFRLQQVQKYRALASELAGEEKLLHDNMHPDLQSVMRQKRILLFKRMMEDAGVVDAQLCEELTNGFRLVGQLESSGQFRPRLKPAELSVEELRRSAKWAKHAVAGSCKRVGDDKEVAEAVWAETVSQRDAGWIKGPFSAKELDQKFPEGWIPSKRFGVVQGTKVRAVDDFSEFLVNAACGTGEQIVLQGLDDVASAAKYMLSAPGKDGNIWVPSAEGKHVCAGPLEASWREAELGDLQGRALDLKSAYKQLARSPEDDWCPILAVWSPELEDICFFESVALPFGAVSAVNAFNRVAKCLRLILCRLFLLTNTSFFDDYCQLEFAPLCTSAWKTAETVLALLGWKVAMSEDKRLPFSKKFSMLGAVVDLSNSMEGTVQISNKPSRIEELLAFVGELELGADFTENKLQSLRGRLLYAAGNTFGRCTQVAVQALGRVARKGTSMVLEDEMLACIQYAVRTLAGSLPRQVKAWKDEWPVLIFTDGACEEDGVVVTHGAVLCDVTTGSYFFFGDHVPRSFVEAWTKGGRKQVIYQAELFPIWIAKVTWKHLLNGRQVLWFCDNEAARSAMIRSYSPLLDSLQLVRCCAFEDVAAQSTNWYARVPSKSNISDAASRLDFGCYASLGFTKVMPNYAHDLV